MSRRRYYRKRRMSSKEAVIYLLFWLVVLIFSAIVNTLNGLNLNGTVITSILFGIALIGLIAFNIYRKIKRREAFIKSGIRDVDTMKGTEFESFLKAHFERMGYKASLTPVTNDYGADLILVRDGVTTVVQAKRYSSTVGIKAVQEVVSSIAHYKADKGIIVTNSTFTQNAINLAKSNNIELIDREILITMLVQDEKKIDTTLKEVVVSEEINRCPMCGSELHVKHGRHGLFTGCRNYPICKYTAKY